MLNLFFVLLLVSFFFCSIYSKDIVKYPYSFVFDCGSSSTKLYVYKYESRSEREVIITQLFTNTSYTGIGEYLHRLEDLDQDFIYAIDSAINHVPELSYTNLDQVTLFAGATAGLRMMSETASATIIQRLRSVIKSNYNFQMSDRHIRILSGQEESVFGWNSIQYILGITDFSDKTFGSLDLGGASTQISFIPDNEIISEKITISMYDQIIELYSTSFLRYGLDQVFELSLSELVDGEDVVMHPCLFLGFERVYDGVRYVGGANSSECLVLVKKLLHLNKYCFYPYKYERKPHIDIYDNSSLCTINGEYLPIIREDKKFVAFNGFAFAVNGLHMDLNNYYAPEDILVNAWEFCDKRNYSWALLHSNLPERFVFSQCFNVFYAYALLTDGYHFDKNSKNQIFFASDLNKKKLSWSIGLLLYEYNLLDILFSKHSFRDLKKLIDSYLKSTITLSVFFVFSLFLICILSLVIIYLLMKRYKEQSSDKYKILHN